MSSTAVKVAAVHRLFVRNLPWTVGNRELKEYFSAFGHVGTASVSFDKNTGMSRGYGFVNFTKEETFDLVYKQKVHSLHGRKLGIEKAVGTGTT